MVQIQRQFPTIQLELRHLQVLLLWFQLEQLHRVPGLVIELVQIMVVQEI